eukprot:CAMPEP_0115832150 /NCGR_PEP_ID=MMETSP0287-20121206/2509_1 /TAXON_ID=412157 /ORGANISM="Chrysochromulina rotalis, Strain UIO044" /LENGTH=636 /DNA_ID=CAMNT_0003285525 /DNA_START=18 /DNA_END=1928 /DNA_ORIENTATION=-
MIGVLYATFLEPVTTTRDVLFFPSEACKRRLVQLLQAAEVSCDVCVYVITDDDLRDTLLALHRRGVRVRVISDDEQSLARDSDVMQLAEAGVPTIVDPEIRQPRAPNRRSLYRIERNMHNKFALVDSKLLLTGSFNWTNSASSRNFENVLVTSETQAVAAYAAEFDRLWRDFTEHLGMSTHAAAVRIQALGRGLQARSGGWSDGGSADASMSPTTLLSPLTPKSTNRLRRASTTEHTLAEQAVLEVEWGVAVDDLLDSLRPSVPTLAPADAKMALERLNPKPSQANILRDTTLRHIAERLDDRRPRSVALLKAGGVILSALESALYQPPTLKDTLFFPSEKSHARLLAHIGRATRSCDVAMYSLTDDRIRDALLALHRRSVRVRIISDDANAASEGSDIMQLAEAGIPTVVGCELAPRAASTSRPARRKGRHQRESKEPETTGMTTGAKPLSRLMHDKFVLVDEAVLITGSYNFTYAAASKNCENLLVTNDSFFVQRYSAEFGQLWERFYAGIFGDVDTTGAPALVSRCEAVVRLQAIHRGRTARKSISESVSKRSGSGRLLSRAFPDLTTSATFDKAAATMPAAVISDDPARQGRAIEVSTYADSSLDNILGSCLASASGSRKRPVGVQWGEDVK